MRARIDVSEIEAQTKIRAKYLRALENEEWGLLPGPTFVKSFLRTYAQALGSTARRWSRSTGCTTSARARARSSRSSRRLAARRAKGSSGGALARIHAGGRRDRRRHRAADRAARRRRSAPVAPPRAKPNAPRRHTSHTRQPRDQNHGDGAPRATAPIVALSLTSERGGLRVPDRRQRAQADPGLELQPGETTPTYHARRFRDHARQQLGDDVRRRHAAHGAGLEPGDRLLDHQGPRSPAAVRRRSCRPAGERTARAASSSPAPRC